MRASEQAAWDGWQDGRADDYRFTGRWRGGRYWGDYLHGRDRGLADAEAENRRQYEEAHGGR